MSNETIEKLNTLIEAIPPLSQTTSRLLSKIGEPHHSLGDITEIVENDALLTSLVLKTANSASMKITQEVETVDDAIRYLGDSVVAGLAMKQEKSDIYNADLSGYFAETDENWAHSLKTAIAARYIAKRFTNGDVRESVAYTAGIVHDIGKALLAQFLNSSEIKELQGNDFIEKEKTMTGIDHAEAGFMLAVKWGLPTAITEVIRYHHSPNECDESLRKLVYTVHLADMISMMSGSGTGIDSMQHTIASDYIDYIDVDERGLETAYFEIQLEFKTTFEAIQKSFQADCEDKEGRK